MGISQRKYIKLVTSHGFSLDKVLADVIDNSYYPSVKNLWRIFTPEEKEIVKRSYVVNLKDNVIKRK